MKCRKSYKSTYLTWRDKNPKTQTTLEIQSPLDHLKSSNEEFTEMTKTWKEVILGSHNSILYPLHYLPLNILCKMCAWEHYLFNTGVLRCLLKHMWNILIFLLGWKTWLIIWQKSMLTVVNIKTLSWRYMILHLQNKLKVEEILNV